MMGKFRHVKQVIGNTPHNLSHFCIIIVGIGQLLQMEIGIPPHIRLDFRSHHMPHVRHIVAGRRIHYPKHKVKQP